jgi:hypothetical protein
MFRAVGLVPARAFEDWTLPAYESGLGMGREPGIHRSCAFEGLRSFARMIRSLRDASQVGPHGVAQRGKRDERLTLELRSAEFGRELPTFERRVDPEVKRASFPKQSALSQ